jgi:hypothetical protein
MLFTFGNFWKMLLVVVTSWAIYGGTNFEFTVITLLAVLLYHKVKEE